MENKNKMESLFRESEKHLSIQPSADAWSRMENRLDSLPEKKNGKVVRMSRFRLLSLAASLVLLVGAVYFFQNSSSSFDMANGDGFQPTFLETLTGAEDCNPYCAVLKNRKELPAEYSTRIKR